MTMNSIIVDDEPVSHDVLQTYIRDIPAIEVVAAFDNAIAASAWLQEHQVDLIFLDIDMPRLTGLGFVKSIVDPPQVIFTTAYPQFAVEGFDLDATEYLLKPFSFGRFLKAVNKALAKHEQSSVPPSSHLMIKSDKRIFRIAHREILYLKAAGDYVKVVTLRKTYLSNDTMKHFEQMLPSGEFVRIHRSYLVAVASIDFIEGNQVVVEGSHLPVGKFYKEDLMNLLG